MELDSQPPPASLSPAEIVRRRKKKCQEIKEVFFCFVIRLLYIAINLSYTSHNKAFQQSALHRQNPRGCIYPITGNVHSFCLFPFLSCCNALVGLVNN